MSSDDRYDLSIQEVWKKLHRFGKYELKLNEFQEQLLASAVDAAEDLGVEQVKVPLGVAKAMLQDFKDVRDMIFAAQVMIGLLTLMAASAMQSQGVCVQYQNLAFFMKHRLGLMWTEDRQGIALAVLPQSEIQGGNPFQS